MTSSDRRFEFSVSSANHSLLCAYIEITYPILTGSVAYSNLKSDKILPTTPITVTFQSRYM